uniref:Protein kinase domain-containing protein n=1 Tax=Arcella intermedia TaxID=1963864 RepID=A0A6B2LA42_9EUKA
METKTVVAIKRPEGQLKHTVREIRLLKYLRNVDNVVRLHEAFRDGPAVDDVFLVMEFVESNLNDLIFKKGKVLGLVEVKSITHQLLLALQYLHRCNVVHRDLKPANVLISMAGGTPKVKLCDFGHGRFKPQNSLAMSNLLELTTLFYIPPEGILSKRMYETSVDMWSLGCIFVEMITHKALFCANTRNPKISLLNKMVEVCGRPANEELNYPESHYLLHVKSLPRAPPQLEILLKEVNVDVLDLAKSFLQFVTERRITAEEALKHPFFSDCPHPIDNNQYPLEPFYDPQEDDTKTWEDLLQQELDFFKNAQ